MIFCARAPLAAAAAAASTFCDGTKFQPCPAALSLSLSSPPHSPQQPFNIYKPKQKKTPPQKRFDWELEADDGGVGRWSRCLDQVWRGAERSGSSEVNFVPTHHWVPPSRGGAGVGRYCLMVRGG